MNQAMYEVWWSRGDGTHAGPRFRTLDDALRYVETHAGEASFAIKGPVGFWHRRADGSAAHRRR